MNGDLSKPRSVASVGEPPASATFWCSISAISTTDGPIK